MTFILELDSCAMTLYSSWLLQKLKASLGTSCQTCLLIFTSSAGLPCFPQFTVSALSKNPYNILTSLISIPGLQLCFLFDIMFTCSQSGPSKYLLNKYMTCQQSTSRENLLRACTLTAVSVECQPPQCLEGGEEQINRPQASLPLILKNFQKKTTTVYHQHAGFQECFT